MLSLEKIAFIALRERGFLPDFSKEALNELAKIESPIKPYSEKVRDLRHFLWVSIDNDDSRDLDQVTYAEGNRFYVAISDVDTLVRKNSAIDLYAKHNTTSIYTPARIFPMLPPKLSYHLTSLQPHTERCANIVEFEIDSEGKFDLIDIYPAWIHNKAQLTYRGVGCILQGGPPTLCHPIPPIPGILDQLHLQDHLTQKIQSYRDRKGSLSFRMIELEAKIENGIAVGVAEREHNRAHSLIENAMIAANVCVTRYLTDKKVPTLRRIVKVPRRWDRIIVLAKEKGVELPSNPDIQALRQFLLVQQESFPAQFPDLFLAVIKLIGRGEYVLGLHAKSSLVHFDLAEHQYAHTTAPNRRYPDLVMQRLLKSVLFGLPVPYSAQELEKIALYCTQKEDDAQKVERRMIKCAAAMVMAPHVGTIFKGMITGSGSKGTWLRMLDPPLEGKVVQGFEGLDVGDYIRAKLIHVDILSGHIDFKRV